MTRYVSIALLLLAAAQSVWAGDCSVVAIGASSNANAGVTLPVNMPDQSGAHPGDLMFFHSGTYGASGVSTNNPTGYTLLKQGATVSQEVWVKVRGRTTETDPQIQWNTKNAGYITILRNTAGFPNEASLLGDSATGNQSGSTTMYYGALSVTQGGECAFQMANKDVPDANTNTPTSVDLTSGYTASGFARGNTVNSPTLASQFFTTDATSPDLSAQVPAIQGNSTSGTSRWIALTLLSGDKVADNLTAFTDVTGATVSTNYTHAALGVAGFDNWTDISVTGDASCAVNPGNSGWVTSGYINVAETYQVRVDSSSSPNTAVSCAVTIGTKSDTYSVTTAAGDTTPDNYSWTGDVTLQELSSASDYSNIVTIGGLAAGTPAAITVAGDTGCAYSKNGAAATSNAGTVVNDDTVKLQVTTSASASTATTCQSTIGGVDGTSAFTATTADFIPAGYDTFVDLTDITRSANTCSNAVALSGLTGAAAVSVDIGTCRVGSAGYTALTCGVAGNGETVQMCHTASAAYATDTTQTMSIGPTSVTATFKSTTEAAPSATEAPILFSDLFTGANGTALTAHTPTTDVPGHGYTKVGSGTLEIQSNKLSVATNTFALVDTDETVLEGDVDWIIPAASIQAAQIRGRYVDANNYFQCTFTEESDSVVIRRVLAGVSLDLDTHTGTVPITEATHSIGMFFAGDQIGCLLDHAKVALVTDSSLNTAQGFAFGSFQSTTFTFDNLYIKHAYQVVRTDTLTVPDDPQGLFSGETLNPLGYYWAKSDDLPDKTYAAWTLYEGGSWYYSPEVAFVGDDVWGWERWNPSTAAIESSTLTYTTQGAGLTAAVWQVAAINVSLPIGVPASLDLATLYLTTRGVLAASCTTNGTLGGMAMSDPANCIYSGTPNTGYTAAQALTFTATNVTGAPTKVINFTITGDGVPDFPIFTPVTSATPSASAVACPDTVTLTQTDIPFAITVAGDTGCKYVKDGGAASAAATTGVSGTTLALQVNAGTAGTTKVCTATAGGVSQSCTVTASTPVSADVDDFEFPTLTHVAVLTAQEGCAAITGNTAAAAVTVSGGTCTIDGGTCPGNVPSGGGTVCAQHTSSASSNTPTNTVVTISGKQGTFTSVTSGAVPTYVAGCIVDADYELLVGDSIQKNLTACWTGADSFQITGLPSDSSPLGECAVSGAAITCDALALDGFFITTVVAINSQGTDTRYLNWDIQVSDDPGTPVHPHPPTRRVRH